MHCLDDMVIGGAMLHVMIVIRIVPQLEIEDERGAPWDSLMIGNGLHPTTEGHRLLAGKVLEQCPELHVCA